MNKGNTVFSSPVDVIFFSHGQWGLVEFRNGLVENKNISMLLLSNE